MSTTLYTKQQFSSAVAVSGGVSTYRYLSSTPNVLAFISSITNKINGTTQLTDTAGGTVIAWISPPLAAAVTIGIGSVTYNGWPLTSSVTGAPKLIGRCFKYSAGVETQFSTATSANVQGTTVIEDFFLDFAPTPTAFAVGDRIVLKFFVSSTSATGTETLHYGGTGTGGSDGSNFVQFAEDISFMQEAEFIQYASNGNFGASNTCVTTLPGVSAPGNLLVLVAFILTDSLVSIVSDKGDTFIPLPGNPTTWDVGLTEYFWFVQNQIGGSATAVTLTKSTSSSSGLGVRFAEYAGIAADALDVSTIPATGSGTALASNVPAQTNFTNELIVGMEDDASGATTSPGAGFVNRAPGFDSIHFDMSVTSPGVYQAFSTVTPTSTWVTTVVSFKWATQPNPIPGLVVRAMGPSMRI